MPEQSLPDEPRSIVAVEQESLPSKDRIEFIFTTVNNYLSTTEKRIHESNVPEEVADIARFKVLNQVHTNLMWLRMGLSTDMLAGSGMVTAESLDSLVTEKQSAPDYLANLKFVSNFSPDKKAKTIVAENLIAMDQELLVLAITIAEKKLATQPEIYAKIVGQERFDIFSELVGKTDEGFVTAAYFMQDIVNLRNVEKTIVPESVEEYRHRFFSSAQGRKAPMVDQIIKALEPNAQTAIKQITQHGDELQFEKRNFL